METFQEKKWFVYLEDHHEGPFSLEDIQGKITQGTVTSQNYVWADGMSDWQPMPSVSAFEPLMKSPTKNGKISEPVINLESHLVSPSVPESEPEPEPVIDPQYIPQLEPQISSHPEVVSPEVSNATIGAPTLHQPPQIETPPAVVHSPKKSFQLLKAFLILMIPTSLGIAYFLGFLNPVMQSADFFNPYLIKLAEKVPVLDRWISVLPKLPDVSPAEMAELRENTREKITSGVARIGIAITQGDISVPSFYIASNAPEGTSFEVVVEGVPDTLLNHLSFTNQVQVKISKKIAKTGPIQFSDGRPIPRGEYWIYVFESEQQSAEVKSVLAKLSPSTVEMSPQLPRGLKLVAKKSYFLGGPKDSTYEERLKEFHDKLHEKAAAELSEIRQFTQTLDSQFAATLTEFNRLRKGDRPSAASQKSWANFHHKWSLLTKQLQESFGKWTPESLQKDYFFGSFYSLIQDLGQGVDKLHQLQNTFFTSTVDPTSFDIQLGEISSQTANSLTDLRAKTEQAEKVSLTTSGIPRKEGL